MRVQFHARVAGPSRARAITPSPIHVVRARGPQQQGRERGGGAGRVEWPQGVRR